MAIQYKIIELVGKLKFRNYFLKTRTTTYTLYERPFQRCINRSGRNASHKFIQRRQNR